MKKEVALTVSPTNLDVLPYETTIIGNPEFPSYAVEMFGIKLGHELGGNVVTTRKVSANTYKVFDCEVFSEAALSDPKLSNVLAIITVA